MSALELADYVVAAIALLVGLGIGRRMRPRPPEPIRPICSCKHGFGSHAAGRQCHAEGLVVVDHLGTRRLKPCPCLQYDGPDPAIFGLGV